jgi:hypothetical protein
MMGSGGRVFLRAVRICGGEGRGEKHSAHEERDTVVCWRGFLTFYSF